MNKETHLIEYKRELSDTFERSVVAFLNSNTGGHIYIGISDDGIIHGVNDTDNLQKQIADRILNNIKPNSIGLFEIINEEHSDKEGNLQNVIHVIVSGGTEKPYYLKKYGMTPNGCYIRIGSSTHEMTENMIMEAFARRAKLSLAKIPAPRQDLTFSQLRIYYEESGKALNSQFAKTLELLLPDGRYNYNAYNIIFAGRKVDQYFMVCSGEI
ncbi:MAG: ATP-binding protein [Spirochaetales bacterium]|nr:ATP-binding protein [Spirochaetales bacterium]